MKKRLLFAFSVAVILILTLSVTVSAQWWDDNPFKDVKCDAWYYDAVRVCNENELFNGTSATTFTPDMKMSRAMLAQVLANADGFDKTEYTGTSFSDVKASDWFAPAVEWASKNGVTSGTGNGKFSPNALITREQLATMLQRYAEFKGMDVDSTASINSFADAGKVSDWAKAGVEWAVANSVIKGADVKGTLYLNPQNNAVRSECAQMLSNFLYIKPVYEINGNDLALYTIVYPEECLGTVESAANKLSVYIEKSVGVKLPVVSDAAEVGEYEILVGETNREAMGLVTVNRSGFESDQQFVCAVQGNYLVIAGIDDDVDLNTFEDRSHHNIQGTYNAVYYFLEKEFGIEFYYDNDGVAVSPDPIISLENGYYYSDAPLFESIGTYIYSLGEDNYLGTSYYKDWGCGLPHQIGNLMTGKWKEGIIENTTGNPCYTDPDNIESLITNTRELLTEKYKVNLVGLIQTDSDTICKCSNCAAVYREMGSRSAPLLNLVNTVAETFEDEFSDVKFATWAYTWSSAPPTKDGFKLHENVILYYNTISLCPCHEYTDKTCKNNVDFAEDLANWGEIATTLYLWEHTGSFGDAMAPLFDLDSIHSNQQYFYKNGVKGAFLNGRTGRASSLMEVRAYLFQELWLNPMMTKEEYNYRLNGFLQIYYGDAWKYIRNYIDIINEIGNVGCTGTHSKINSMYNYDLVCKSGEKINAIWDKAEAEADNELYLERIKIHRLSWTYLWQVARYQSDYTNGSAASRTAYKEVSQKLYEEIIKYNVKWDGFHDEPSGDLDISPDLW